MGDRLVSTSGLLRGIGNVVQVLAKLEGTSVVYSVVVC